MADVTERLTLPYPEYLRSGDVKVHKMTRTLILGYPRCGKSTLAKKIAAGRPVFATDNLKELPWSEASDAASRWFDRPPPWVIEGTMAVRALRKWLLRHAGDQETPCGAQPCDELIYLTKPYSALTPGQRSMGKGIETMLNELEPELSRRGIPIGTP